MVGETIGHYKVVERIGSGGMGIVYKAEDMRLGRPVALKFLPPELSSSPTAVERFQREARTASSLNHPNICTIYAIDEHEGQKFLVMELLDGQPLNELIGGRPMSTEQLLDLGVQMGDALDAAHSQGILHRDIKPANIFVTRKGRVKVLDFGLAKLALLSRESDAHDSHPTMAEVLLTTDGVALGTVAYMSPEQARGEVLDARSDVFSFGIVLYEMATGQQAFPGRTSAVVFDAILNRTPPPASLVQGDVPAPIERIIGRALDKDIHRRYQSAAELRDDLQRAKVERDSGRHLANSGPVRVAPDDEETPTVMLSANAIARSGSEPVPPPAPAPSGAPAPPPVSAPVPAAAPPTPRPSGSDVPWASFAPPRAGGSGPSAVVERRADDPDLTPPQGTPVATPAPPPPVPPPPPPVAAKPAPVATAPGGGSKAATLVVGAVIVVCLLVGLGAVALFFMSRSTASNDPAAAATTTAPATTVPTPPVTTTPPPPAPPAAVDPATVPAPPPVPEAAPAPPAPGTPAASAADAAKKGKKTVVPAGAKRPVDVLPATPILPAVPKEAPKVDQGEVLLGTARTKIEARQFDQAESDLQAIAKDHPSSGVAPQAFLLMAKVQSQQGRLDAAIDWASSLRSHYPAAAATAEGSVLLGQWLERSKRPDRIATARTVLGDVPQKFGDTVWAPRALAAKALLETRERVKDTDPAFGSVPAAFLTNRLLAERYASAPEAELAFWQVGDEFEGRKRYDLAAKAFADLGAHFPETRYDAWWRAAELYDKRLKDRPAAQAAYAKVPAASKNYKEAQKRAQ